jgi:hypothetical protein
MARYLFPDFLNDPEQYRQAEELWLKTWNALVEEVGQAPLWQSPFLATSFADGTPCRDGNPIFSAVDPARRIGVRIIQFEPTGDEEELVSWLDTFAEGEPEEVRELVISCSLTDSTLLKARDLIRRWITRGGADSDVDDHRFLAIIEEARDQCRRGMGLSPEDVRRELDLR